MRQKEATKSYCTKCPNRFRAKPVEASYSQSTKVLGARHQNVRLLATWGSRKAVQRNHLTVFDVAQSQGIPAPEQLQQKESAFCLGATDAAFSALHPAFKLEN